MLGFNSNVILETLDLKKKKKTGRACLLRALGDRTAPSSSVASQTSLTSPLGPQRKWKREAEAEQRHRRRQEGGGVREKTEERTEQI